MGPQTVKTMARNKTNKNRSKNLYDNMVWTPRRKEGLGKHGSFVTRVLPAIPVVVSKAKKQLVESISIECGAFVFHYDSWAALRNDYRALVVRVATIAETMSQ